MASTAKQFQLISTYVPIEFYFFFLFLLTLPPPSPRASFLGLRFSGWVVLETALCYFDYVYDNSQ